MQNKLMSLISITLITVLLSCQILAKDSYNNQQINRIIEANEEPAGVVFELLAWDENTWEWAAPMLTDFRKQLLAKYPGLDIAIVSHGGEQFQLTKTNAAKQAEAIATLSELSTAGVDVHVCGVHSSWEGIAVDDYLDFVDVSPSGPAQINDYLKLGYKKILISGDD